MTQVTLSNVAANALIEACRDAGLPQPSWQPDATFRNTVVTWNPDLTAPQLATLTTIQSLAVGSSLLTVTERTNLQGDIDGLVTFQGLASPTLAQTVLAVKAQSRILRAILRS